MASQTFQIKKHSTLIAYRSYLIGTLALLTVLFFFGGPDDYASRSYKETWNLGHILYFALLPLVVCSYPRLRTASDKTQALLSISLAAVIGTLVEILQGGFNRNMDIADIQRDLVGAAAAVIFLLPIRKKFPKSAVILLRVGFCLVMAAQLHPVAVAIVDEHQARCDFPMLSDFQTSFQFGRWHTIDNTTYAVAKNIGKSGNFALQIDLTTSEYTGVRLKYFPSNWVTYQKFQFRALNPSMQSLPLTCRVQDEQYTNGAKDRFKKKMLISPGWNTITIDMSEIRQAPDTRLMDLTRIREIGFYAVRITRPVRIYLDDVKLIGRPHGPISGSR